jgi:NAD(P)-dependent dehydrogenase (short-subunit alcohol dehydrogenase family)
MPTTLVIGASRGIGLAFSRLYTARGDTVIAAVRTPSPELDAMGVESISGVEVTSDAGVGVLVRALGGRTIDLLVHNAGVLGRESLDNLDFDRIRTQFEVNAMGPLRVASALLPNLARGAKVGLVTSRMGSIADNTSGGRYGYRMSKAALNMAGVSLAHDLAPRGVAVALLHPGFVRTDLTGGNGDVDADTAAAGLAARLDELTLETTGQFWHANGSRIPW